MENLKLCKTIHLKRKDNGEFDSISIYLDSENNSYLTIYPNGKVIDMGQLERDYEDTNSIKDLVEDYIKEQNDHAKDREDDEKEREPDPDGRENSIDESDKIKEGKIERENSNQKIEIQTDGKVKRKPTHVIETIKPDQAKMDYWDTVREAFGLPSRVKTLAFAYPISTEDKVDYANITIYMLDNDGNIIDDLDVDDYFEFDSSTGNNPMNDNTIRFEEDENKGKVDNKSNDTMIRLKAKKAPDSNTYISMEQINGLGDYHDINAGRKYFAGTQNVEKQLETDRVIVFNSNTEKLVNLKDGGIYRLNKEYNEAKDKGKGQDYINTEQADGIKDGPDSYIPNTEFKWKELAEVLGEEDIEKLQENFYKNYNGKNQNEIIRDMKEQTEKEREPEEDLGRYREGPWDSAKH